MKPNSKLNILILNGSIHGADGNCAKVISHIGRNYGERFAFTIAHLLSEKKSKLKKKLKNSDAIIALTGTYWESWGSPMQKFFEDFTDFEATDLFMGKPCGAIVLSHSTGGKSVLSRLLNTFNLLGCLIPPLAGIELSQVAQAALKSKEMRTGKADIWRKSDIAVILENIRCSLSNERPKAWPVDSKDFRRVWIE